MGESQEKGQAQEPKMNVSFPPPAPSSGWNRRQNSLRAREMSEAREPKKSVSMGQIQPTGNTPASATDAKVVRRDQDINGNTDAVDVPSGGQTPRSVSPATKIKEHKSEYKQRFRPFSQYEYIGDGKFNNASTSPPNEVETEAGSKFFHRQKIQAQDNNLAGEPWYQEVIELRKQANDYKQRGWGTDLVPPHMSQIYNQQMTLHEQAARRESLSALSLAITTPRSMDKDEKDKENMRKASPNKPRSSRPRTAPPKSYKKVGGSRSESARPSPTPGIKEPAKETPRDVKDSGKEGKPSSGRSVSAGSGGPKTSKSARDTPETGWRVHLDTKETPRAQSAKRQRPNHDAKDRVGSTEGRKISTVSRASSKAASRDPSRPPSAIENTIDYFREPVVKSPPEPTRVKSPEQLLMRSPDPINWTVPLDTGKTFSVTQSVRDSDSARNSPMSDHSSHFDSVSGTAINLGPHTVNEKGALQHHKVSALAREAKELQGLSAQKKDEKTDNNSSLPEENTPNPTEINNGDNKDAVSTIQGSINGSEEKKVFNGLTDEDKIKTSTNGETKVNEENIKPIIATPAIKAAPVVGASKVPGSNLKCLDDPNFSFDTPISSAKSAPPSDIHKPTNEPKKPSYRVLEDPEDIVPTKKSSPYKVLEDPMTASFYQQEPLGQSGTASSGKSRPE